MLEFADLAPPVFDRGAKGVKLNEHQLTGYSWPKRAITE
jgi:hypothetical protein